MFQARLKEMFRLSLSKSIWQQLSDCGLCLYFWHVHQIKVCPLCLSYSLSLSRGCASNDVRSCYGPFLSSLVLCSPRSGNFYGYSGWFIYSCISTSSTAFAFVFCTHAGSNYETWNAAVTRGSGSKILAAQCRDCLYDVGLWIVSSRQLDEILKEIRKVVQKRFALNPALPFLFGSTFVDQIKCRVLRISRKVWAYCSTTYAVTRRRLKFSAVELYNYFVVTNVWVQSSQSTLDLGTLLLNGFLARKISSISVVFIRIIMISRRPPCWSLIHLKVLHGVRLCLIRDLC